MKNFNFAIVQSVGIFSQGLQIQNIFATQLIRFYQHAKISTNFIR